MKAILEKIECVMNKEEHNFNIDQGVEEINMFIDIIRDKNVQTKCKRLQINTIKTDFTTANEDKATVNTARSTLENETMRERALAEWNENNHASNRNKQKDKHRDLLKKWANYPALKRLKKIQKQTLKHRSHLHMLQCKQPCPRT